MLGLPKSTEMSKQLPKKAVYAKFQMNTAAKEKIDADISRITIVNEITPAKINIPAGEEVGSFFVLLVALKKKDFDERTVATLSKLIPQNILFVLEFEGQSKLAIYHTKLMQTNWKPTESCTIEPRGLNLDKVWENIVVDIGGVSIADGNTLDEQIAADERRQKIEKEITKLEKQARAEKQPKKKFELVQQIKKLNTEMGKLSTRSFRQCMTTAFSRICSLTVTKPRLRITRLMRTLPRKSFRRCGVRSTISTPTPLILTALS